MVACGKKQNTKTCMNNIWRRAIDVWKVDFLARFVSGLHTDVRTTVWFWIVINSIFALVVSVMVFFALLGIKPALQEFIRTNIPDDAQVVLQNGVLDVRNMSNPSLQTMRYEDPTTEREEDAVLIIDTHGDTYNLTTLEDYGRGVALFAHKAYVKDSGEIQEISFQDIPDFTASKNDVNAWVDRYLLPTVIAIVLFVAVFMVIMFSIMRAILALWWALILMVTGYIMRVRISYRMAYMSVLNFYFIPLVVQIVLMLFDVEVAYLTFAIFLVVFIANLLWMRRNMRGDGTETATKDTQSAATDTPPVAPSTDHREQ